MSAELSASLAVRKSIVVNAPVERAFALFTEGIASWWPTLSHSIHGDEVETVVFEPREGGRVYERARNGEEAHWADVRAFEAPTRILLDWRVNPQRPATELEIRFVPEGDGTRVELVHSGWEAYGETAAGGRDGYDSGWDVVLGRYADAAG
jgi:uncharacterized protein YndB with AHSA1/START domain